MIWTSVDNTNTTQTFLRLNGGSGIRLKVFSPTGATNIDTTKTYNDGNWHHIAFTTDFTTTADGVKIYFDGDLLHQGTLSSSGIKDTVINRLATQTKGNTTSFIGQLSNIAFFNSVLTAGNIETLYNNGTPETAISFSPIAWWKLDNTTITDSSGNGNTGTNNGATQVSSLVSTLNGTSSGMNTANLVNSDLERSIPYSSYSMYFDGTLDHLDAGTGIGNSLGIYTGDLTLSFWFNTNSLTANRGLFYIGSFGNAQGEFQVNIYSNSIRFRVDGGTPTKKLNTPGLLSTNTWYHIGFVYKAGDISGSKVYLNGAEETTEDSGTFPSSLSFSGLKTIIGGYYGTGNVFGGKLSNTALFNKSLTENEILTIYNGGVPNDISSLSPLAWWSLSGDSYYNGANWVCPDLSGSNNAEGAMETDSLVGEGPGSEANGVGTGMNIPGNLQGNAPNSNANAFSVNMNFGDKTNDVPVVS